MVIFNLLFVLIGNLTKKNIPRIFEKVLIETKNTSNYRGVNVSLGTCRESKFTNFFSSQ